MYNIEFILLYLLSLSLHLLVLSICWWSDLVSNTVIFYWKIPLFSCAFIFWNTLFLNIFFSIFCWKYLPGSSKHFSWYFTICHLFGFRKETFFYGISGSDTLRLILLNFVILKTDYFLWSLIDLQCLILVKAFKVFAFLLPSHRLSFRFKNPWITRISDSYFHFLVF